MLKFKRNYINWKYGKTHNPLAILMEVYPEKNWDIEQNPNTYYNDNNCVPVWYTWGYERFWNFLEGEDPLLYSEDLKITIDDLFENPHISIEEMSSHPVVSFQDTLTFSHHKWDWDNFSENSSLTVKDILKHPQIPWNWKRLSSNRFLFNDITYQNNLKSDIKKRREKIASLPLFGSLETLVAKYIGYV
jgi:hypothetical protein